MPNTSDPKAPDGPSLDISAKTQSTVADVDIAAGSARLHAEDGSRIGGIKSGHQPEKPDEKLGKKFWLQELGLPLTVTIVGGIVVGVIILLVTNWASLTKG